MTSPADDWQPSALEARWAALPDVPRGWLRRWINPRHQTRLYLAHLVARGVARVGEGTYGRPKVRFPESGAKLTIGRYGSIADRVEILLGGGHRLDWLSTYPFPAFPQDWPAAAARADHHVGRGDVTIGHDVWLASQCMILSGVTVGHGAVVAARAVVTKDVPPYAIVAGNPAKLLRLRFDEATIETLLAAAWWDWPKERIAAALPALMSGDIEALRP